LRAISSPLSVQKSEPPNARGETFMSVVEEIARRIVSAKMRSARDIKKPPQSTAKLTPPKDKNCCNINYLIVG
jgi:hypothetical protein